MTHYPQSAGDGELELPVQRDNGLFRFHMLCGTCCRRGLGEWGEKRVRCGGEEQVGGGRGGAFCYHLVNGGKGGVDGSYCTHLTEGHNPLLLETERESTKKEMGGKTEDTTTGDKTQGETGVRYWRRETCL